MAVVLLQLDPPMPVEVAASSDATDGEDAWCVAWLDYGPDYDMLWLCLLKETRTFWFVRQNQIRGVENITFGRKKKESKKAAK